MLYLSRFFKSRTRRPDAEDRFIGLGSNEEPVFRIALVGLRETGKTCILASFLVEPVPNHEGITASWVDDPTPSLIKKAGWGEKEQQQALDGEKWLQDVKDAFEDEQLPDSNTGYNFAFRALFAVTTPHSRYYLDIIDYPGEILQPGRIMREKGNELRDILAATDGSVVVVPAPRIGEEGAVSSNIANLRSALVNLGVRKSKSTSPTAMAVNKWDRRGDISFDQHDNEKQRLGQFILTEFPNSGHKNIYDLLNDTTNVGCEYFPVSVFGKVKEDETTKNSLEDRRRKEVPENFKPLQSFNVLVSFAWVIDRLQEYGVEQIEEKVNRIGYWHVWNLLLTPWLRSRLRIELGKSRQNKKTEPRMRSIIRQFWLTNAIHTSIVIAGIAIAIPSWITYSDYEQVQTIAGSIKSLGIKRNTLVKYRDWLENYRMSNIYYRGGSHLLVLSSDKAIEYKSKIINKIARIDIETQVANYDEKVKEWNNGRLRLLSENGGQYFLNNPVSIIDMPRPAFDRDALPPDLESVVEKTDKSVSIVQAQIRDEVDRTRVLNAINRVNEFLAKALVYRNEVEKKIRDGKELDTVPAPLKRPPICPRDLRTKVESEETTKKLYELCKEAQTIVKIWPQLHEQSRFSVWIHTGSAILIEAQDVANNPNVSRETINQHKKKVNQALIPYKISPEYITPELQKKNDELIEKLNDVVGELLKREYSVLIANTIKAANKYLSKGELAKAIAEMSKIEGEVPAKKEWLIAFPNRGIFELRQRFNKKLSLKEDEVKLNEELERIENDQNIKKAMKPLDQKFSQNIKEIRDAIRWSSEQKAYGAVKTAFREWKPGQLLDKVETACKNYRSIKPRSTLKGRVGSYCEKLEVSLSSEIEMTIESYQSHWSICGGNTQFNIYWNGKYITTAKAVVRNNRAQIGAPFSVMYPKDRSPSLKISITNNGRSFGWSCRDHQGESGRMSYAVMLGTSQLTIYDNSTRNRSGTLNISFRRKNENITLPEWRR